MLIYRDLDAEVDWKYCGTAVGDDIPPPAIASVAVPPVVGVFVESNCNCDIKADDKLIFCLLFRLEPSRPTIESVLISPDPPFEALLEVLAAGVPVVLLVLILVVFDRRL